MKRKEKGEPAAADMPAAASIPTLTDAVPNPVPPSTENCFHLTCTNHSSINGAMHFIAYPPPLTLHPPQKQIFHPLISDPTVSADDDIAVAVMSWMPPPEGMQFLTINPGCTVADAVRISVQLGQTVTVSWVNRGLEAVAARGGPSDEITVIFEPRIPGKAAVGLAAGPGPVVFAVPVGVTRMTIAPRSLPKFRVRFGTPPTSEGFSDLSEPLDVLFVGPNAAITVGPNNTLYQTD